MREKYRNPIASIKKFPQFTIMNVIDGQAGLIICASLIFYSLTTDNILNIIVLLILAGISIQMLTGDNGILTKAAEAKENTEQSQLEEQRRLASMEAATNLTETVYNDGEKEIKIPSGFAPTGIEGENTVDEGLVITDSKGNEFVWVEVPNDETGPEYPENATDAQIETALRTYVSDVISIGTTSSDNSKTTFGCTDEWYSGCGLSEGEYNILKSKMLNSIKNNEGFWIGRYEAGIDGSDKNISLARQAHIDITTSSPKAVSKIDCIPYNWVTCSEAQELASNVSNNGSYNSSLMFGIQWDLVLKFLNNKGIDKGDLVFNSGSWGNYYLTEFLLNQPTAHGYKGVLSTSNFSTITWEKIPSGYKRTAGTMDFIALSTGASERNMKKNIYDFAGNMNEWTLENRTDSYTSVVRGGEFVNVGAASRRNCYPANYHLVYTCFRVSLY